MTIQGARTAVAGFLVLVFTAAGLSAAELRVRVVNRTAGAPPLPVLEVMLQPSPEGQSKGSRTAKTNARGVALFSKLKAGADIQYSAEVTYKNVKYDSGSIRLTEKKKTTTVELPVYETTTSPDALTVPAQHTLLRPRRGFLEVREIYLFQNRTDRTYIGTREVRPGLRSVLEFPLPKGFTKLQLNEGLMSCCVIKQNNRLVDTMELKPGRRVVRFQYLMPSSSHLSFRPAVVADTDQYNLLVSPALKVTNVSGLRDAGEFKAGAEAFHRYDARGLTPGNSASIEISGIPGDRASLLRWFALVFGIGVAGLLVWWAVSHKRGPETAIRAEQTRESLLEAIVRLDESFEAGKISRSDYEALRKSKKAELAMTTVTDPKSGQSSGSQDDDG